MVTSSNVLNPHDPEIQMEEQVSLLIIAKMIKALHLQLVFFKVISEGAQLVRLCLKPGLVVEAQVVDDLLVVLDGLSCEQSWCHVVHECWWSLHCRILI